jgi:hypothetical protein
MKLCAMLVGLLLPVALVQPSDAMTRIDGRYGRVARAIPPQVCGNTRFWRADHDRRELFFCLHARNRTNPEEKGSVLPNEQSSGFHVLMTKTVSEPLA